MQKKQTTNYTNFTYYELHITQLSQVDKRPALDFPRQNNAKDKQCAKRGQSRVRLLPKAGKRITKAW